MLNFRHTEPVLMKRVVWWRGVEVSIRKSQHHQDTRHSCAEPLAPLHTATDTGSTCAFVLCNPNYMILKLAQLRTQSSSAVTLVQTWRNATATVYEHCVLLTMGGGGHYDYPKHVWSPAGGWMWERAPRAWKRNTGQFLSLFSFLVFTYFKKTFPTLPQASLLQFSAFV